MTSQGTPCARRRGGDPAQQRHALGRARDDDRAALLPAGGKPGLGLETRVEVDRVLHEPRHVLVRAQLADEAGGMPGRAAGEPPLLEEHDVALAHLRQVIGDRAADHAAADDDDLGGGGEGGAIDQTPGNRGRSRTWIPAPDKKPQIPTLCCDARPKNPSPERERGRGECPGRGTEGSQAPPERARPHPVALRATRPLPFGRGEKSP